jgi:MtN3 and saliva related transmembrane protein
MTVTTAIGLAGAFCTTFCLIPQVVKAHRSKSTTDVSMGWLAILSVGTVLWLIYGLLLNDLPLIAGNGVTLILVALIFVLKLRHG